MAENAIGENNGRREGTDRAGGGGGGGVASGVGQKGVWVAATKGQAVAGRQVGAMQQGGGGRWEGWGRAGREAGSRVGWWYR